MADKLNKVPKTYSLDPAVIAWVTQRAARLTIEGLNGERANDSKVVNDILTAAMQEDKHLDNLKAHVVGKKIKAVSKS